MIIAILKAMRDICIETYELRQAMARRYRTVTND
jgi:hypothetical protein